MYVAGTYWPAGCMCLKLHEDALRKSPCVKMSKKKLPASIKSSLVITANVLLPSGSTSRAAKKLNRKFFIIVDILNFQNKNSGANLPIFRLSEVAISALAADTARMIELGLAMNFISKVRIWTSMSSGWSPTGTLVKPTRNYDKNIPFF